MPEIDTLGAASEAAMASLDAPTDPTPVPVAEPVADTLSAPEPVVPAVPDFRASKHRVKVRGEEIETDYDELLKGYSRQADYTRSKQELADHFKRVQEQEAIIQRQREELNTVFATDPLLQQAAQLAQQYRVPFNQALTHLVQEARGQQQQTPGEVTPDEIATIAQARDIAAREARAAQTQIQQMREQIRQETLKEIEAAKQEIRITHESQGHAQEINATLSGLFEKNPILGAVENMEDVLRFKVYQADPATIEEAKDLFVRFAEEQAEKLTAQFNELNKSKLIKKEKLVSGGIEPPGGAAISQQPKDYKFGSKDLSSAAEQYLNDLIK